MRAYGLRKGDELVCDYLGAPSRHRKNRSAVRRAGRRLLHKAGRRQGKVAVSVVVKEMDC
jgi:hypothetical protein